MTDEKVRIAGRVPARFKREAEKAAIDRGQTMGQFMIEAVSRVMGWDPREHGVEPTRQARRRRGEPATN